MSDGLLEPLARTSFRSAVTTDFRGAAWSSRLALLALVGWLAYEWGAGNETVTPWVLAKVISNTRGVLAIPVAAGVGFALTTLQQLASGFTALAAFSIFDRTSRAAWDRLRTRAETASGQWSTLSVPARCALVFAFGTTAVALIQVVSTGQVGVRRHGAVVMRSALLCGLLVSLLGGFAAGVAVVGRNVDSLSGPTHWILRVLGNPLFWIGLLLVGLVVSRIRRSRQPIPLPAP